MFVLARAGMYYIVYYYKTLQVNFTLLGTFCPKSLHRGTSTRCCCEPAVLIVGADCCIANFLRSPSLLLILLDSSKRRGGVVEGESTAVQWSYRVCLSLGVGGNGVVAILGNGRGHESNSLCNSSASVQYSSKSPSPALNLL